MDDYELSLALSIAKLEAIIRVPENKRDVRWADNVCTTSRRIHINVWRLAPEHEYVQMNIIPLLHIAQNELRSMLHGGDFNRTNEQKVASFIQNIELRINNIQNNYLAGRPSEFIPRDKLKDRPSNIS